MANLFYPNFLDKLMFLNSNKKTEKKAAQFFGFFVAV